MKKAKKKGRVRLIRVKISSKKEIGDMLENEVFSTDEFKEHIKEVSIINEVHYDVALDIIKDYLFDVMVKALSKDHKKPLIINLTGFIKIEVKTRKDYLNKINY